MLLLAGCSRGPAVIIESYSRGEENSSADLTVQSRQDPQEPWKAGESALPESTEEQEASQTLPFVSSSFTEEGNSETRNPARPGDKGKSSRVYNQTEETFPSDSDSSTAEEDLIEETEESEGASESSRETDAPSSTVKEEEPESKPGKDRPRSSQKETKRADSENETAYPTAEPAPNIPPLPSQELTGQRLPGVNYETYLPVPDWAGRGGASPSLAMQYGGYYTKNADEKVLYITFCMDYENGYTNQMMDTLSSLGIRAAFFITGTYLSNRPDMARTILNRGHVLGSHSYRHRYTHELSDVELINDFVLSKRLFQDSLGYSLQYYRPAYGFIMERDMVLAQRFGLTTVMFSFNYADYDLSRQPGKWEALDRLKSGLRPGAIYYLHVTPCNIQALPEFAAYARSLGYTFLRLDETKAGNGPAIPQESTKTPETTEEPAPPPGSEEPQVTDSSVTDSETDSSEDADPETEAPMTAPPETEEESSAAEESPAESEEHEELPGPASSDEETEGNTETEKPPEESPAD